ncbi:MAG: reverse transcriptase-like protein [Candidatus Microsaccharimonas sossegonensis]|uniref:Reverse transcriptase-like protein n=1 Tax=Candidatus Microsaccharimonas sossegonensis TaxID=2506948 RepID=A0A4Q0AH38_9BACT|nr:MAG: reverse transcriptase-like protein [Candidatus Microsaccharimonas sossegonensis]
MKQRLSVRAIINDGGKALVVRRANGRPTILGKYELPGGKLAYNEQPEDALRRYLHDDIGMHVKSAQLFDVVTYIDHDDRGIQYAVIVYLVMPAETNRPIKLSGNYNKYKYSVMSQFQQNELTDLTQLLLGIIQQEEITDKTFKTVKVSGAKNTSDDMITIFSDGGSRGNPGPSAAGYVILDSSQQVIAEGGEYLGITTNNQAEYHGVRLGLEKAIELKCKRVDFKLDSMLVVNQMKGFYKIKNRELWPIHERIRGLMTKFERVTFYHVMREFNQLADGMVNKTLDEHMNERAEDQQQT